MMGDRRDVALDWLLIDGSRPGEDTDMVFFFFFCF